jgi:hypothetical protein
VGPSRARAAASSSGVGSVEDMVMAMGCGDPKLLETGEIRRCTLSWKCESHNSNAITLRSTFPKAKTLLTLDRTRCVFLLRAGNQFIRLIN